MRKSYIWSALATGCAIGTVVACTTTTPATLHDQLLAYTSKGYERAKRTGKWHADTVLKDDTLKLSVTNLDATSGIRKTAGSLSTKAVGDDVEVLECQATCQSAAVDGKPHDITMVEDDWPVMGDHDNQCTVTDMTMAPMRVTADDPAKDNRLVCTFDQEFQKYSVSSGGQTLKIVTNPDGTYRVDGKPAATVDAAAALIVANPVGQAASLQSCGAILATLQARKAVVDGIATEATVALSMLQQTLTPINCAQSNMRVGPTPPDPAPLVRAVIALREAQP
ncbi:MAG: hypothetical protein H7338_18135 [Candidatus Sericytochromatia bacterium]|nr:hypothetical protein [Candidatus Sericytochromatia bacterium]